MSVMGDQEVFCLKRHFSGMGVGFYVCKHDELYQRVDGYSREAKRIFSRMVWNISTKASGTLRMIFRL